MKFTTTVDGVVLAKRALALLGDECRKECIAAVDQSSALAVTEAKARAPRRTGELASTIRRVKSKDELVAWLQVGYGQMSRRLKGGFTESKRKRSQIAFWLRKYAPQESADLPGVYAMVVEFGDARRHHPAEPFITPAMEVVRPGHEQRIAAALDRATQTAGRES